MDQAQIEALSLFQEGEYEKAKESMAKSNTITPEDFKVFVGQCNQILAEQYKYLIVDALSSGDYTRANALRERFREKHGRKDAIESLTIPNVVKTQESYNKSSDFKTIVEERKNPYRMATIISCIVAFVIIIFLLVLGNLSGNRNNDEESAVEVADEEVIDDSSDIYMNSGSDNTNVITSECVVRPISSHFNSQILVPSFLTEVSSIDNGGYKYQASNGAFLITMCGNSDLSAERFVNESCNTHNSTYKRATDNWAVNSGRQDSMYYYAKAIKIDKILYYAFFAVPNDKENAKTLQELTEKIFNGSNFPLYHEVDSLNDKCIISPPNNYIIANEYKQLVESCKAKGMVGVAINGQGRMDMEFYAGDRYKDSDSEGSYTRIPGGILFGNYNRDGEVLIYNGKSYGIGTDEFVDTKNLTVRFLDETPVSIDQYCREHESSCNVVDLVFYWFK